MLKCLDHNLTILILTGILTLPCLKHFRAVNDDPSILTYRGDRDKVRNPLWTGPSLSTRRDLGFGAVLGVQSNSTLSSRMSNV